MTKIQKDQNYKYAKALSVRWKLPKRVILKKLMEKGLPSKEAYALINLLEEEGIINEERTFLLQIEFLESKRYGFKRIKERLFNKGFSPTLISTYIFNKDIELDNCIYYLNKGVKKYKNHRYSDDDREKLINYLKRYGFNDKMISEVIKIGINYENVKWIFRWWTHLWPISG